MRSSDGRSWTVLDASEEPQRSLAIGSPIAIGAPADDGVRRREILRLRIDSLGPDIPPT